MKRFLLLACIPGILIIATQCVEALNLKRKKTKVALRNNNLGSERRGSWAIPGR